MPDYLISAADMGKNDVGGENNNLFQRQTRNYNDNDKLKFKSKITPKINAFSQSFFYRTFQEWNKLSKELRDIESPGTFKAKLKEHLWLIAEQNLVSN